MNYRKNISLTHQMWHYVKITYFLNKPPMSTTHGHSSTLNYRMRLHVSFYVSIVTFNMALCSIPTLGS